MRYENICMFIGIFFFDENVVMSILKLLCGYIYILFEVKGKFLEYCLKRIVF